MQLVKMYQASDWEIKEETETYFLLTRNKSSAIGHILVFLLFWWTLGLANLGYHLISKQTKKIVK